MTKELLFSVTSSDCDWEYMRGTGPGGQKRNKTESKVRCTHRASGAVGESDETRDQRKNRQHAFRKMANSETFKKWHRLETARRMGTLKTVEDNVEAAMRPHNLKVETFSKEEGRWIDTGPDVDINTEHGG